MADPALKKPRLTSPERYLHLFRQNISFTRKHEMAKTLFPISSKAKIKIIQSLK